MGGTPPSRLFAERSVSPTWYLLNTRVSTLYSSRSKRHRIGANHFVNNSSKIGRPDLSVTGLAFVLSGGVMFSLSPSLVEAALSYTRVGFSVLPLLGKRPALATWKPYQSTPASLQRILAWHQAGLFHNIGLVCGPASGNLVVLDLDGWAAYDCFRQRFPDLARTYTVITGSGTGTHLYWRVAHLPPTYRVLGTSWGNFELCAQGRQVVAPPSIHSLTGYPYRVYQDFPIRELDNLNAVLNWLATLRSRPRSSVIYPRLSGTLNPRLVLALTETFLARGSNQRGDWLNGHCPYPQRHSHQDCHPSFGFNLRSGYGYCFVCGTLLAKDLCVVLNIDIFSLGGVFAL